MDMCIMLKGLKSFAIIIICQQSNYTWDTNT